MQDVRSQPSPEGIGASRRRKQAKNERTPGQVVELVRSALLARKGQWKQLAKNTGKQLTYRWIAAFAHGDIRDPSYTRLALLAQRLDVRIGIVETLSDKGRAGARRMTAEPGPSYTAEAIEGILRKALAHGELAPLLDILSWHLAHLVARYGVAATGDVLARLGTYIRTAEQARLAAAEREQLKAAGRKPH